jgi:hypothetical protein
VVEPFGVLVGEELQHVTLDFSSLGVVETPALLTQPDLRSAMTVRVPRLQARSAAWSWGWWESKHRVNVADRLRVNGRLWHSQGKARSRGPVFRNDP